MTQTKKWLAGATAIVVVVLIVVHSLGVIRFTWPFAHANQVHTSVAQSGPARIVRIEPINLDCRVRVTAEIPVRGVKAHKLWGWGYRHDVVTGTAIGDEDTCVRGGANIQELKNGGWLVMISANQIVFNRPRVDLPKTAATVNFNKGWVGKLTDAAPGVSDNNPVVPWTLAYAQVVVGSAPCMQAAWAPTLKALTTAYQSQAAAKHLDPHKVMVVVNGTPNFSQHAHDLDASKIHGYTFQVDTKKITCVLQTGT